MSAGLWHKAFRNCSFASYVFTALALVLSRRARLLESQPELWRTLQCHGAAGAVQVPFTWAA